MQPYTPVYGCDSTFSSLTIGRACRHLQRRLQIHSASFVLLLHAANPFAASCRYHVCSLPAFVLLLSCVRLLHVALLAKQERLPVSMRKAGWYVLPEGGECAFKEGHYAYFLPSVGDAEPFVPPPCREQGKPGMAGQRGPGARPGRLSGRGSAGRLGRARALER